MCEKHTNSIILVITKRVKPHHMTPLKKSSIHIIYIPGLGDRYNSIRRLALGVWQKRYHVDTQLVPMSWQDSNDTLKDKYQRVQAAISSYPSKDPIILIGESAGACIAINFLQATHPKVYVVTLCGKIYRAHTVSRLTYARNPGLREALLSADDVVKDLSAAQKKRAITIYNPNDPVVSSSDATLSGIPKVPLKLRGHLRAITTVLFVKPHIIFTAISKLIQA